METTVNFKLCSSSVYDFRVEHPKAALLRGDSEWDGLRISGKENRKLRYNTLAVCPKQEKWGHAKLYINCKQPQTADVGPSKEYNGKTVGTTLRALSSKNRGPKKWLGQHYMVNDEVTLRTVEAANIQPGDVVLEVGPGTGSLTQALLDAGACVIGVEKDPDMAALCVERFADNPNVEIINGDFLKLHFAPKVLVALKEKSKIDLGNSSGIRAKVVANLPFNITTDVVQKLLPMGDIFSHVVLMLQDEAALRLVDTTPCCSEYRGMNIFVHFYSKPIYHFFIDRKCFLPPPNVNAAVVSFEVKRPEEYPIVSSPKAFFSMVNGAFNSKRKMLRKTLQFLFEQDQIVAALSKLNLPPTARPGELSLEKFTDLFNELDRTTMTETESLLLATLQENRR